jgi:hypothetical protein
MRASANTRSAAAGATLLAAAAVAAAAPGAAESQRPPRGPSLTLDARPATIVFGDRVALSGRLRGASPDRDVLVRLEADTTRPYGDAYGPAGSVTRTGPSGNYAFTVTPGRNTQYRAVAESSPPLTSGARLVVVRMRVGLIVSDATPRRGQRVRFSGSVSPEHDGRAALVQRRSPSGRFATVARTALRDAGTARSRYSRRVRIRRDGVYRVKAPGDEDHVNGFSRERAIDVRG